MKEEETSEIEKIKQQVDYYRKEAEDLHKELGKEQDEHWKTKEKLFNAMIPVYGVISAGKKAMNETQRAMGQAQGELIKAGNAFDQTEAPLATFLTNLKNELDAHKFQQKQEAAQQQQQGQ